MVSLVPDKTGRVNVQSEYYIFSFFKPNSSIGKGQKILETNYNIFITSKNTEICSNSLYLILSSADVRTGKLISRDYQIRSTETVQFFDYLCINFDIFVFCKQQGKCAELVYCQNFRGNEKWIF